MEMRVICTRKNFYPRSPCGERLTIMLYDTSSLIFLSTLSLRRATPTQTKQTEVHTIFLSTLSLRRATISCAWSASKLGDFYPRSPCGERRPGRIWLTAFAYFYPRSPCGERQVLFWQSIQKAVFLSTLSLRRATRMFASLFFGRFYFYPRSPCGERHSIDEH